MIGIVATAQVLISLKYGGFDAKELFNPLGTLASFARCDGSFPFISNVNSVGVVDATAWACLALTTCSTPLENYKDVVTGAIDWLLASQNDDGGWGILESNKSRVVSTTVAVRALISAESESPDIKRSINRGLKYVISSQLQSGAWADCNGRECLGATAYSLILLSEVDKKQSAAALNAVKFISLAADKSTLWEECNNREEIQVVEKGQHRRLNFIYPIAHLFIRAVSACDLIAKLPSYVLEEYLKQVGDGRAFIGDRTDAGKETSYGQHDLIMSLIELKKNGHAVVKHTVYPDFMAINKKNYPQIYHVGGEITAQTDVIFIHGLTGDARATWLNGDSNFYLPLELAKSTGVRSFAVGYSNPASRFMGKGMSLEERTKNLLLLLRSNSMLQRDTILVGHSFGGLLIKKLVLSLKIQGDDHEFRNLKGIVFLATPHFGSGWANILYMAQGFFAGTQAVKDLFLKSKELVILGDNFNGLVCHSSIKLESFGENSNLMIVGASSSNPGISSCKHTPIDASHIDICKPKDSASLVFSSMKKFVKGLARV